MKNREIKFRAWFGEDMIYQGLSNGQMTIGDLFNNFPSTLMQFTGRKDKNGVDIYEGDYLVDRWIDDDDEDQEALLPVVWDHKNMQWCVDASFRKDGSYMVGMKEYFRFQDLEVNGNIFENPKNEEE